MQYISPLSLLPNNATEGFTKKDLVLAKRKLLAEFELLGTPTINFNNKEVSKNDVLVFFESLEKNSELDFHLTVAKDPQLLQFLEKHTITHYTKFSTLKQEQSQAFIEWVSPYYKAAFRASSLRIFKERKYYELHNLIGNADLMTAQDTTRAWEPLQAYMRGLQHELESINEQSTPQQHKNDISRLTSLDFVKLINLLPFEHFSQEINAYAFEMMQCSIQVFNKNSNDWGMAILQNAMKLNVDEPTRQALDDKEEEMNGIILRRNQPASSSKGSGDNTWVIIRVIAFMVFIFFKIATCNKSSSYSSTDFRISEYNNSGDKVIEEVNKYRKLNAVSNHHFPQDTVLMAFLSGIKYSSVEKKTPAYSQFKTGDDPYQKYWLAPHFKKYLKPTLQAIDKLQDDYNLKDEQLLPKLFHPVTVKNNSNFEVIVFVCRKDSVFSRFIKPHDQLDVILLEGSNKMYMYAGNNFSPTKGLSFKLNEDAKKPVKAAGGFSSNQFPNLHFLDNPIYYSCSRNYEESPSKASIAIENKTGSDGRNTISLGIKDAQPYTTHLSMFDKEFQE